MFRKSSALIWVFSFFVTIQVAASQPPAIMWSTNIGGRLFAVDDQTNSYANVGGTVIKLSPMGTPLATNEICPVPPSVAQRDSAGNYYFAGKFDGTYDFGGITITGGWTNWPNPGQWSPGYPTCFLAKYASNGVIQWVKSIGEQALNNTLSDLRVDPVGNCYAAYTVYAALNSEGRLSHFDYSGSPQWDKEVAYHPFSSQGVITVGGVTSTNCTLFIYNANGDGTGTIYGDRVATSGSDIHFGSVFPFYYSTSIVTNGRPVIDGQAEVFLAGICDSCGGTEVLRKFAPNGTESGTFAIEGGEQWTLASDQSGVYLAGTEGTLYKRDFNGNLIWSTNLPSPCNAMVLDAHGNRFVSLPNGTVSRIGAENAAGPIQLSTSEASDGMKLDGFHLTIVGDPYAVYQILGSTNLIGWDFLGYATNATGSAEFIDSTATNSPKKFYKATQ